ncbi:MULTISPECIES: sterol desaturase family protein [Sphingomonas]|uniref:sterol desaturase family protein n=1 Tax=Sphingomonas TaxID=13687 RepID=UPI001923806B|nr:sterol desaturase family protein [Sphingomonas sp. CCH10-B3]
MPEDFYLAVRLTSFTAVLALMIGLEHAVPRRARILARWRRWPGNMAMVVIDSVVARLIFPIALIGVAASGEALEWGLLNQVALPGWVEVVIAVMMLDLAIYGQHFAFHATPSLWRIHRMHHSDPELDVTTALRFHPAEILLSLLLKFLLVVVLGASPLAVLIFEVLLNATAMFNHSNIALPLRVDVLLRQVLVTPDMHRVHHSIDARESGSNFGFNLPWWDWLFGTYRAQPAAGHQDMTIGVADFRAGRDQRIDQLLIQPLRRGTGKGADHG